MSEANGHRSREEVTVVSGQNLEAGHVVGKVTSSGKYKEYDPSNADGSETAVGVLYGPVDASGGDEQGTALLRDAEVDRDQLTWFDGATEAEKDTGVGELADTGIIAR